MSRQDITMKKKSSSPKPARPVRTHWLYVVAASLPYFLGLTIEKLNNNYITGALILVALPVILASWYYGIWWGLLSAAIAIILNGIYLLSSAPSDWASLMSFLVPGGLMTLLISFITGKMRERTNEQIRTQTELRARERHLTLINMTIEDVLNTQDPENRNFNLIFHLVNIFIADCAHLVHWNPAKKQATLFASTTRPEQSFPETLLDSKEKSLIESISQNKTALALDDVLNSPHNPANPTLSKILAPPIQSALCMPLITNEYEFGIAIITYNSPHHFSTQELQYANMTGNQIALALRAVQQEAKIQKQLIEANTLSNIERALSKTERISPLHVLQFIVDAAKELIPNADQAIIHLLDKEEQVLVPQAVSGFKDVSSAANRELKMRLGQGVAGQVIDKGIVVNIKDVHTDPNFLQQKDPVHYRSLLVAPVQSGEDNLGTISIQSHIPDLFTSDDEVLITSLGIQAAIAIENARLFETTKQGYAEVSALYHITQELASSLETEKLMKEAVDLLQQNFGYYHTAIWVVEPKTEDLVVQHGNGKIGELLKGQHLPAGAGIIGHVAETKEPFFTNNVNEVVFFSPHPLLPDTQSELAMPIKIGERVFGVLDVQQKHPNRLSERDFQLVRTVADQLAVALQKASLYSDLQASLAQEKSIRSQLMQSERLALVGRLLASVSHELNNPLQAIQNALFLIQEEKGLSPQGQQDLQIVLSETERMASLIERLRNSYRPTRLEEFQPVQINTIVEDVYALVSTHLRHKQVAFEFHPDPDLPLVLGLPDPLRQVILNLLMNAVEAISAGGLVTVSTKKTKDREILLSVSDTGPGIDPVLLPHIFDAFITSKDSGTGLGLTITYDIVHRHNGRIQAENNPKSGATFRIWLPIFPTEQA